MSLVLLAFFFLKVLLVTLLIKINNFETKCKLFA